MLGYDIDAADGARGSSPTCMATARTCCVRSALVPGEHRLLAMFADLRALARPRHDEDDPRSGCSQPAGASARLPALARRGGGAPARVVPGAPASGARALRHREPRPHARAGGGVLPAVPLPAAGRAVRRAVLAILDRRLEQADELAGVAGPDFREALDRLAAATERPRPGARRSRARGAVRVLRRACHRRRARRGLRGDGRRHRGARAGPWARRSRRAPRRARRLPVAAGPDARTPDGGCAAGRSARAAGGDGAPVLPPARRSSRSPRRPSTATGSLTARYRHEGPPRHLATCFVDLAELPGAAARRRRLGHGAARR